MAKIIITLEDDKNGNLSLLSDPPVGDLIRDVIDRSKNTLGHVTIAEGAAMLVFKMLFKLGGLKSNENGI